MVYQSKFVMAVLKDGIPLKELANSSVPIPFESTYSLRFRNKNNRRAVVKFFIDGENVAGSGYIIPANDYIDIERHGDVDKKFKFVSLDSSDAIDFGKNGDNEDKVKGVIEARFYFEKEVKPVTIIHQWPVYTPPTEIHHHHHHGYHDYRPYSLYGGASGASTPCGTIWSKNAASYRGCGGDSGSVTTTGSLDYSAQNFSAQGASFNCSDSDEYKCDVLGFTDIQEQTLGREQKRSKISHKYEKTLRDGCTVEGEHSQQRFSTSWIDLEDTYITLKVFLQGFDPEVEQVQVKQHVVKPVTRKANTVDSEEFTPTQLKIKELEAKVEELKLAALEKELADLQTKAEA